MPETVNDKSVFTLLEVTRSIRKTLSERYRDAYWIRAELNKLNFYKQSGHCFPELVEKQEGRVVAQMRSTIWSDDYIRINKKFLNILNEPLKDGIKILFQATVNFEPTFGLSLHITDIDPSYTLGDLERENRKPSSDCKEKISSIKIKHSKLPLLLNDLPLSLMLPVKVMQTLSRSSKPTTAGTVFSYAVSLPVAGRESNSCDDQSTQKNSKSSWPFRCGGHHQGRWR